MKKATVADLRNNFSSLSKHLRGGETITITKRGIPFARLSPIRKPPKPSLEDRFSRLKKIFPEGPVISETRETLDYDRGDR